MPRRIHVQTPLTIGTIALVAGQAHHVRDVLRLKIGEQIEAFDDAGNLADAIIEQCDSNGVTLRIKQIRTSPNQPQITIAAAVPKGDRADWMIEKLSELGVNRFVPLATARSVVLPAGKNKFERWIRIATESAKQSHRNGVMRINALTPLEKAIVEGQRAEGSGQKEQNVCTNFYLTTTTDAAPILSISYLCPHPSALIFFIGPEGGWSDDEIARFQNAHLTGLKLTATILRVETAAIAAAAIVTSIIAANTRA